MRLYEVEGILVQGKSKIKYSFLSVEGALYEATDQVGPKCANVSLEPGPCPLS